MVPPFDFGAFSSSAKNEEMTPIIIPLMVSSKTPEFIPSFPTEHQQGDLVLRFLS